MHIVNDDDVLDTEIDWVAYMQQIETYHSGDLDYSHYMVTITMNDPHEYQCRAKQDHVSTGEATCTSSLCYTS